MSVAFSLKLAAGAFNSFVQTARAFLAQHKLRFNGFGEV
jgi:hypothetical protein